MNQDIPVVFVANDFALCQLAAIASAGFPRLGVYFPASATVLSAQKTSASRTSTIRISIDASPRSRRGWSLVRAAGMAQ